MDSAGKQFLSSTALAQEKDGAVGSRNTLHLRGCGPHGGMVADNARKAETLRVLFLQNNILAQQLLPFDGASKQMLQMFQVDRLLNEIESALAHGGNGF